MNVRLHRGFTVAEVLTVLVIVALLLSAIALTMPLILKSPAEVQSQVDNVNSAALALYKMQRDVRQSNINGVLACTMPPVVVCSAPAPQASNPPVTAVAVVTADDGTGQFADNVVNGSPTWKGFYIYWLTPNSDGTSNQLNRAYYATSIPLLNGVPNPALVPGIAVTALVNSIGSSTYATVAQNVVSMSIAVDLGNSTVDLQVDGGDTKGNVSSLRLTSNSYVRN